MTRRSPPFVARWVLSHSSLETALSAFCCAKHLVASSHRGWTHSRVRGMAALDTLARPRHVFTCCSLALPTLRRPLGNSLPFVARCDYTAGLAPLQMFSYMQDVGTGQVLYIYVHTISILWGGGAEHETTILLARAAPLATLRRSLGRHSDPIASCLLFEYSGFPQMYKV